MGRARKRFRIGQSVGAWRAIPKGWVWYLGRVSYHGGNRWRVAERYATRTNAIRALLVTIQDTLPRPPTKFVSSPQQRWTGKKPRWIWSATDLDMSLERAQQEIAREREFDGAKDPEQDLRTWRTWQAANVRAPWFRWAKAQGKVLIQYSAHVEKAQYPGKSPFAVNEIWSGHYRRFDTRKLTAHKDVSLRITEGRKHGSVTLFAAGFWIRWQIGTKHEDPGRKKKKASRKMDS